MWHLTEEWQGFCELAEANGVKLVPAVGMLGADEALGELAVVHEVDASQISNGAEKPHKKKNKFLGTEVPRNFSDQCSLDFAYFLCLFSGRWAKSSQELCSWELFFSYFRWFFSFRKSAINQKNPRVRKIRVRNSGAGNGSPNVMDTWKKMRSFCRKTCVHKIPRLGGGGGILGLGGGGVRRFYFLWARGFF